MKRTLGLSTFLLVTGLALAQEQPRGWRTLGDSPNDPANQQRNGSGDFSSNEQGPPPPSYAPPQAAPGNLTLPAGTYIRVRVNDFLSTDQNHAGDSFSMTLSEPLIAQGFVVARRGQTLGGHIAEVEKAGRVKGTSRLGLELTGLTLVDGQQIPIRSELINFSGGTSNGRDAGAIVATSGIGAIIGGAAQGAGAAGIGAAAGAAAATIGVLTTRGRAAVVYPEDTLTFRILAAVPINTEASQQAFQPVRQADYENNVRNRPPQIQTRVARPPVWGGYYGPGYYGPGWGYPSPYYGYYGYGPTIRIYGRFGGRGGRRW